MKKPIPEPLSSDMGLIVATVAGVAGLPGSPYKRSPVGSIPTTST